MTLKYQGTYILKSTLDRCEYWKQYLISKGFDSKAFTLK